MTNIIIFSDIFYFQFFMVTLIFFKNYREIIKYFDYVYYLCVFIKTILNFEYHEI